MAVKKKGLGKGLDSLIPEKSNKPLAKEPAEEKRESESGSGIQMMKINMVEPNRDQPRKKFDEDAILELADSIKQFGVLQPLLVRKNKDYYEIIAGERRWRAAKQAGVKEVPVIVKEYTEQEIVEIGLIENIQRENLNPIKGSIAKVTNRSFTKGTLKDALVGADIFIGVSAPGVLTAEMIKTMNDDPVVFAMANPTPEIMPDEAKKAGVKIMGTGRSDFPNQINNVIAFPGIFRGALDVRASQITENMKIAAAYAIAGLVSDDDLNEEYILPQAFDPRVKNAVAKAVSEAAIKDGVNRI